MKCQNCQADNPEGVKFCGECGQSLERELTCPKCGYKNPRNIKFCHDCGNALTEQTPAAAPPPATPQTLQTQSPLPSSFANGRYAVKKFLGEGGKKKVYLAHDTKLDRDVAFALIKTERLDETARTRIEREAQAMGKLGDHPNIVSIYDMGEENGQPFIVLPLMAGGDVEGLIEKAPDHRLPLDKALEIAVAVSRSLEFAHSKGIIHRDLKPGNVWLTANGVAQIGDFGLAVAVDLSRLTQDGMMVGTVSYMPPEQAMGGKTTNKADLYSLGAMLYEMVTGRPPFVGDDSVAIIGQHIQTPPVSPTWHRADLPPALETLILQLLEKDPEKRPQSATVVLQALESIEKGKVSKETPQGTQGTQQTQETQNPLYRRVFVGRELELKQLQSAFDGAMSGQGALMMVMGEPGVGKTSLCEQLETYVTLRGGRPLVGHCYEEGSLSLPYLAFVEAMRSYVLDRNLDDLRKELGTGAADVARIVSEIRERLKIKLRTQKEPEEMYRLMEAVSSFLINAAAVQPLVIILEDLHDADKGTLDMLTHVSRRLSGARLLIVGTYRDVEVDRNHPLSSALAELRRTSSFGRVLLRGLNADEVRRMLESITRESFPWSLAEKIHRQTEGNPLFVQEVIRFLAEEGLLVQKDGRWQAAKGTQLEMSIPEGLRDVIGKRLNILTPECNRLLSAASVIGRDFALETLKAVVSMDEEVFMKALKEAIQLSVLEEHSQVGAVRYRFTHAFFRQTLYEEMIAPQRLKMHQQVARALETQYAKRLEEHGAELAEHFSQSTDPADLTKSVSYGEMAAKRAIDVFAYGEAVRLLEQALKIQRVLDPDDMGKQCDLLLALGDALTIAGEPKRAVDNEIAEAYSLADAIGDQARLSQASTQAIAGLIYWGGSLAYRTPEFARWTERADRYAPPNTVSRAWADFAMGNVNHFKGMTQRHTVLLREGRRLRNQALGLARRLDDPEAFWFIAYTIMINYGAQQYEEKLKLAEELTGRSRIGVAVKTLATALSFACGPLLESGQRQRVDELCKEVKELAERTGQANAILLSMWGESNQATMDGQLEKAAEIVRQIRVRGDELGIPEYAATTADQAGSQHHLLLGNIKETLRRLVNNPTALNPLFLAHVGRHAEAAERLERLVVARPGFGAADDVTRATEDTAWLEAAVMVGHKQAAKMLLERLASTGIRLTGGTQGIRCLAQYLGAAAALLGRPDEARKYYHEAIKICTEMRFRPGLALTRLGLAELLLEHYPAEKKEALEHLDFAIKEFREMKMQPSLERALRHKDFLKA